MIISFANTNKTFLETTAALRYKKRTDPVTKQSDHASITLQNDVVLRFSEDATV